jgi:NAD-dependent deacetylase
VLFLTGAGVSAESGVPTFRGPGGLWRNHRPEEFATPEAFRRDPRLVWEWYAWRQGLVARCEPNAAHRAIAARIGERSGDRVVTQNVDGLHERAARARAEAVEAGGDASAGSELPTRGELHARERPIELHGSLFRVRCTACDHRASLEPGATPIDATAALPRCPDCGALLRPDVVWFGEALDPAVLGEASELAGRADVCVVVGTSALVQPAASLPLLTLEAGGAVVEVNPDATPLSRLAAVSVQATAAAALPAILAEGG